MKPKVIITIEGGLIQNVLSDTEIDVIVVDYDTESYEENEHLTPIPYDFQGKSGYDYAYCMEYPIYNDVEETNKLFTLITNDLNQQIINDLNQNDR
jgi:hypothetical protein